MANIMHIGGGVGPALCKKIAENDGDITTMASEENEETSFFIDLPLAVY